MIEVKNLHKYFGKNKVLQGLSCHIKPGERVVIVGPSGSGKSTFLRCLNFLETPTIGTIRLNGQLIAPKNAEQARRKMGMVFQHFNLFNNLTVMENLTLAPIELGLLSPIAAERRALALLRKVSLLNKRDTYPSSLSGGQKQRIAIIRALMMDPEVMLFDEPTSALDPESIGEVLDVIRQLARSGMTMIVVTHEINFAKEIATRMIFIDKGKIAEDAAPKLFFSRPENPRLQDFLSKVL